MKGSLSCEPTIPPWSIDPEEKNLIHGPEETSTRICVAAEKNMFINRIEWNKFGVTHAKQYDAAAKIIEHSLLVSTQVNQNIMSNIKKF